MKKTLEILEKCSDHPLGYNECKNKLEHRHCELLSAKMLWRENHFSQLEMTLKGRMFLDEQKEKMKLRRWYRVLFREPLFLLFVGFLFSTISTVLAFYLTSRQAEQNRCKCDEWGKCRSQSECQPTAIPPQTTNTHLDYHRSFSYPYILDIIDRCNEK